MDVDRAGLIRRHRQGTYQDWVRLTVADSTNTRADIEDAISSGDHALARRLVRRMWEQDPTAATATTVNAMLKKLPEDPSASSMKIFFLRSFTIEPALGPLEAAAACHGIRVESMVGEFNAHVQEIIDADSRLYSSEPDVIVLAIQSRDLVPGIYLDFADKTAEQIAEIVRDAVGSFRQWLDMVRTRTQAHVIIHNLECPEFPVVSPMDGQDPHGQQAAIRDLNRSLVEIASEYQGVHVLDYDSLVARHGRSRWHDHRKWLTMRMPLAADSLVPLAGEWLRFLVAIAGRSSKCLVCDLDNTMWGGIIGEDGINGIDLGVEYPGAAYQQFQRAVLDLYQQGVIIAICSKNNMDDAMEVIRDHDGMILKEPHFASMRINWQDKVQNLREIAEELNIGIDSLAFIDDNPVEREMVREMLPEVTVIDVDPSDPIGHARAVRENPMFSRVSLSDDDRRRGQMYAEQRQRKDLQTSSSSMEDYYRSLEMVADIGLVDDARLARVAQLTQKTNQLNMTTRRYSEQQIQDFASADDSHVYWINVKDRFGDNGVVGVMILLDRGDTWEFDTFLMSCRVIGRTVETAMLATVVEHARAAGATKLAGSFMPTKKNPPAQAIYESHGFKKISESSEEVRWELDMTTTSIDPPDWITRNTSKGEFLHG